jgi:hypothetical protein
MLMAMLRRVACLVLIVLALPSWSARAQSPSPSADPAAVALLEALEEERRRLESQTRGVTTLEASAAASLEEELPRLEALTRKQPGADALVAYATALAGTGRFALAVPVARQAAALDAKHELAAVTLRELVRFQGNNGPQVLAGLLSARHELERREEMAEARRTLPGIAARAAAHPDPVALLEEAAAHLVLEEFVPALENARRALALEAKNPVAQMIVEELTRPEARAPERVRTAITLRWMKISAGAAASR